MSGSLTNFLVRWCLCTLIKGITSHCSDQLRGRAKPCQGHQACAGTSTSGFLFTCACPLVSWPWTVHILKCHTEPVAVLRDGARSASIQNMGAAMDPGWKGLKTVSMSHGCSLPIAGMLHFCSIPHSCGLCGTLFLINPNSIFTDENTLIWIICLRIQIAYYFFVLADRLSFSFRISLGLEAVCCLVCQLIESRAILGNASISLACKVFTWLMIYAGGATWVCGPGFYKKQVQQALESKQGSSTMASDSVLALPFLSGSWQNSLNSCHQHTVFSNVKITRCFLHGGLLDFSLKCWSKKSMPHITAEWHSRPCQTPRLLLICNWEQQ